MAETDVSKTAARRMGAHAGPTWALGGQVQALQVLVESAKGKPSEAPNTSFDKLFDP
jgi:hypothetical protein